MERMSFNQLLGFISTLLLEIEQQSPSAESITTSLCAIVSASSGEKQALRDGKVSIGQFLSRRLSIPFHDVSYLLDRTPGQMTKDCENEAARKKLMNHLKRKVVYMQNVAANQIGKVEWDDLQANFVSKNTERYEWWHLLNRRTSFAWIPMEYLP